MGGILLAEEGKRGRKGGPPAFFKLHQAVRAETLSCVAGPFSKDGRLKQPQTYLKYRDLGCASDFTIASRVSMDQRAEQIGSAYLCLLWALCGDTRQMKQQTELCF